MEASYHRHDISDEVWALLWTKVNKVDKQKY